MDFSLWLKTLSQCFVLDTMCIKYSTRLSLFHATNFAVQVEQSMICCIATTPQNQLHCCPTKNLVLCCTINLHLLSYSPKLLYAVCSNLHHNNPKISSKWQKKIVWIKYQNSRKKQFKMTYFFSPINHSQGVYKKRTVS